MNYKLLCFVLFLVNSLCDCGSSASKETTASRPSFTVLKIDTRKGPGSVETADFNRDGKMDVVLANAEDSSVSVYLNKGSRQFQLADASPFFVNRFPNDIAIADLDGDGISDLVIANTEASFLTVLKGDGTGRFLQVAHSPFAVHSRPHTHGIAVGDFNGDAKTDLATDDWGENKIVVLHGNGSGDFTNPRFFNVGNRPYQRLRSADLNKDGASDIVTTNLEGNNATVLLGASGGEMLPAKGSPFPCGDAPFGVAIGDVNGDKNLDLAIVNSPTITAESKGKDGLWVLLGDGRGSFKTLEGSPFTTGKSPSRLAIGDVNGDHVNDIAITSYNDRSVTLFFMSRSGVKDHMTLQAGNRPDGICIQDLDGDGRNDILVSNYDDDNIFVFFQNQ